MSDPSTAEPVSVPLSALEHVHYCPRQAGLIHLDRVWSENADTVAGDLAHQRVDIPGGRTRKGTRTVRAMPVHSRTWALHGVCDLVEITGDRAIPIEYKVGRYRPGAAADIQVTAQAICLRESGFTVNEAYIYSAADRRRHPVALTEALETATVGAIEQAHALFRSRRLPPAVNDKRCRACSLRSDCLPELTDGKRSGSREALFQPRDEGTWDD
jgi:CRISPR-associated exonuclease Cas4